LPVDVAPGEDVRVNAMVRAPRRTGRTLVIWDLVHEDTTWFSGQGVPPAVTVLNPDPRTGARQDGGALPINSLDVGSLVQHGFAWRPSRFELWDIALRMWASRPVLGVGPDRFRRIYGEWAERNVFDTRVYSNSLYLELAATLGALGLTAFVAVCILAIRGSSRAPGFSSTLGGSLLVVFLVHGAVDYVLAFTGPYLALGFAWGLATPPPDED
jgi:hypothetical protein